MQSSVILEKTEKIKADVTPVEKGAILHYPYLENTAWPSTKWSWFRVQAECKTWGKGRATPAERKCSNVLSTKLRPYSELEQLNYSTCFHLMSDASHHWKESRQGLAGSWNSTRTNHQFRDTRPWMITHFWAGWGRTRCSCLEQVLPNSSSCRPAFIRTFLHILLPFGLVVILAICFLGLFYSDWYCLACYTETRFTETII